MGKLSVPDSVVGRYREEVGNVVLVTSWPVNTALFTADSRRMTYTELGEAPETEAVTSCKITERRSNSVRAETCHVLCGKQVRHKVHETCVAG